MSSDTLTQNSGVAAGLRITASLPERAPGRRSATSELKEQAAAPSRESREAPFILVVDDDAAIRDLAAETLRDEGFTVSEAADGIQAFDMASTHRPDLVLTDVLMPGLSGPELYARLRLHGYRGPILMMSAYVTSIRSADAPVLRKPFALDTLVKLVNDALGNLSG
jgi:CheY-like chemotaxis protein